MSVNWFYFRQIQFCEANFAQHLHNNLKIHFIILKIENLLPVPELNLMA